MWCDDGLSVCFGDGACRNRRVQVFVSPYVVAEVCLRRCSRKCLVVG